LKKIRLQKLDHELANILRDLQGSDEPLLLETGEGAVVLVSEDDWRSIQETLCLLAVPGLKESICLGMEEAVEECCCCEELGW
jgi:PHD/YefM family antitoxin component YafN of YafNO toxin-antitoxin module